MTRPTDIRLMAMSRLHPIEADLWKVWVSVVDRPFHERRLHSVGPYVVEDDGMSVALLTRAEVLALDHVPKQWGRRSRISQSQIEASLVDILQSTGTPVERPVGASS